MTTYVNGKPIRYPRRWDRVRRIEWDDISEWEVRGMVTGVGEDGTVTVSFDDGDDVVYQPDILSLHPSGWYFHEVAPEVEQKGWG